MTRVTACAGAFALITSIGQSRGTCFLVVCRYCCDSSRDLCWMECILSGPKIQSCLCLVDSVSYVFGPKGWDYNFTGFFLTVLSHSVFGIISVLCRLVLISLVVNIWVTN